MNWDKTRTLVTGGTSFIGSHLVEALVDRGSRVRVVDNLSSGRMEHLDGLTTTGRVELVTDDLLDQQATQRSVRDIDIVFHLAADHSGRGYVDLHQSACATNLALDGMLFQAALEPGVDKVIYAPPDASTRTSGPRIQTRCSTSPRMRLDRRTTPTMYG